MAGTRLEVRPLWSVPDGARRLQLSRATIYRLIERGEIQAFKVGGSLRVLPQEVDRRG